MIYQIGEQYYIKKNINFKTPLLRSELCDSSDANIVLKGKITVKSTDNANKRNIK